MMSVKCILSFAWPIISVVFIFVQKRTIRPSFKFGVDLVIWVSSAFLLVLIARSDHTGLGGAGKSVNQSENSNFNVKKWPSKL